MGELPAVRRTRAITTGECLRPIAAACAVLCFALLSRPDVGHAQPPGDTIAPSVKARVRDAGSLEAAIALSQKLLNAAIRAGDSDSASALLHEVSYTPFAYATTPGAKVDYALALRGLDLSPMPEPHRSRFEVNVLGRIAYSGNLDEAQLGITKLLATRDSLLDERSRAHAHYMLAFCAYYLGDAVASTAHARQAGEASLRGRDTLAAMESFDGVATSFYSQGEIDSALHYGRLCLVLGATTDDTVRLQNVYLNYAEALAAAAVTDSAHYYLDRASHMMAENEWGLRARLRLAYASLYRWEGRSRERIRALKTAAHYFAINNEHHQAIDLRDTIAYAHADMGDYRGAFRYRDRAATQRDSLHAARLAKDTDARLAAIERDGLARQREAAAHREAMAEAVLSNAKLQRVAFGSALVALSLVIAFGVFRMRSRKRRTAELHALVEERTHELTAQAEELRASNAELERFAYIASHDLKTPLRNVTSFVGLAQRRLPPDAREAVGEYLTIAAENARHMHALVSDVLEYSRIGRSDGDAAQDLALASVVEEVKRGMGADLAAAGATVEVSGDARACLPHTSVTQVVANLVENGLKYNTSEAPRVDVAIVDMGQRVRLAVTDNGIGIAPEYHERVFEVFRRLHTVDEYGGTGVGLSTCLKVVRQLGGDIALESEAGIGSTFTVTLPKRVAPRKQATAAHLAPS